MTRAWAAYDGGKDEALEGSAVSTVVLSCDVDVDAKIEGSPGLAGREFSEIKLEVLVS